MKGRPTILINIELNFVLLALIVNQLKITSLRYLLFIETYGCHLLYGLTLPKKEYVH